MMRDLGKFYVQMRHTFLDGAENTQTCRIWGTSPPNILCQQPLNSDTALQEYHCLQTTIFVRDRTTPLIGFQFKALLSANFYDKRVISRYFPDAGHFRSPDLNPCISGCRNF
ncbi:hypothetical protein TNCV_4731771 [Trichonephila clavipes]|nr:hypothetical protein TNCV_4731771 [Trichonephila clavipes]